MAARAQPRPDFHDLAPTPPMGWNSWDSFAATINEEQARANAEVMAEKLLPHGYDIFTVDIQWYEPGATGFEYRVGVELAMDEWGRLLPAPNRFPSAAGGAGFRPLADFVARPRAALRHPSDARRAAARRRPQPADPRQPPSLRRHRRPGQHLPVELGHVRRRHVEARRAGIL